MKALSKFWTRSCPPDRDLHILRRVDASVPEACHTDVTAWVPLTLLHRVSPSTCTDYYTDRQSTLSIPQGYT